MQKIQSTKVNFYTLFFLVLTNAIPLYGVLFNHWQPVAVIVLYIIETIVIGIGQALRLLLYPHFGGDNQVYNPLNRIPLTLFFMFHFGLFVLVQSVLFFGLVSHAYPGLNSDFNPTHNLLLFLKPPYLIAVYFFIFGQMYYTRQEIFVTKLHHKLDKAAYMFLPYPRIFVQQFVVILGAFVFMLSNSVTAIVVLLIVLKTVVEYLGLKYGESLFLKEYKKSY